MNTFNAYFSEHSMHSTGSMHSQYSERNEAYRYVHTDRDVTKRILVVDDRNELLHLMRRVLEDENYQVSILQEGKDAFMRVKTTLPDLLILDLKLGDISGQDVLRQLKDDSLTADIPIIIYTAAVLEAEEVSQVLQSNPQRYAGVQLLQKPFELDTLLDTVELLLNKPVR